MCLHVYGSKYTYAENPFGYKGQVAVRELLVMSSSLQQELKRPHQEITTANLERSAVQDGMVTMLQDGILKVIAGTTSIEEVARVTTENAERFFKI